MNRKKRRTGPDMEGALRLLLAAGLVLAIAYSVLLTGKLGRLQERLRQEGQVISSLSEEASGLRQSLGELEESCSSLEAAASTGEEPEPETTPAETTPPAPQYLDTLVGISAGTVLSPDQIDRLDLSRYFKAQTIDEGGIVYNRIYGKSYRDNNHIGLGDLRYLKVLHYNFDHQVQVGELIVNQALAEDVQYIFTRLFQAGYEIQSMRLIDDFWDAGGDSEQSDWNSIDVNNTSAFCYRTASGSGKLSNHALGRAIDINPQQNPYVSYKRGKASYAHENAAPYIDRDSGAGHVITHDDLCFQLFKERGFIWGGDWSSIKDYQHFEKK